MPRQTGRAVVSSARLRKTALGGAASLLALAVLVACVQGGERRAPVSFQMRPVLGSQRPAAGSCPSDPPQRPDPQQPVAACSQDSDARYELGPAFETNSNVATAEAAASPGDPNVGQVVISFDAAGTAAMTEVSGRISNYPPPLNQFAYLVDGRVQSAPHFQEQIRAGRAVMTTASMAEAQRISDGIQP